MAYRFECDVCGKAFAKDGPYTEDVLGDAFPDIFVKSELDICAECLDTMASALAARLPQEEESD